MEIPTEFHGLLSSRAVAFVGTIGKHGEPQVTPIWFLWDGERVRLSLVEGRQKLRNLQRDPRISLAISTRLGRRTTSSCAAGSTSWRLTPTSHWSGPSPTSTPAAGPTWNHRAPRGMRRASSWSVRPVRGAIPDGRTVRDHGRRMTSEVLRYAAFTDAGIGGNPAGVVLDAGSLNDAEMLAIARDVGYSETAFVLPDETEQPGCATSVRSPRSPSAGTRRWPPPSPWRTATVRGSSTSSRSLDRSG